MRSLMRHYEVKTFLVRNAHIKHLLTIEHQYVVILRKRYACHHASSPILMYFHWRIHIEEVTGFLYRLQHHFVREGVAPRLMKIVKPTVWQVVVKEIYTKKNY